MNIKYVGNLKYHGDWQHIPTMDGDKATMRNSCGSIAHIKIDDGCWLLTITKSIEDKGELYSNSKTGDFISPWWFPEAVDVLVKLHLTEKTSNC